MLITLLEIVEVAVCCILILVVMMQPGSGGIGPAFGGGATQVFGAHGTSKILAVATAICAAIFVVGTVLLAWLSSH